MVKICKVKKIEREKIASVATVLAASIAPMHNLILFIK